MKVDMLFDAVGRVDDSYIISAQNRLESASGRGGAHRSSIYRRVGLTAAALFLFLISSFTVAMAANEDFRNAVFRFFHISTPVQVPPIEEGAGQQEQIMILDSMGAEDAVHVEYLRAEGSFGHTVSNGVIYINNVESGRVISAYAAGNGQLSLLEAHTETLEYSWNDITYSIRFDWYEKDGVISTIAGEYDMDTSAEWTAHAIDGSSELVELRLNYGAQIDYSTYPLLYDLKTHEVIDVLKDCKELKSQNILEAEFSPDLTKILVTCGENVMWYDEYSSTVYCYDIANKNLQPLSELCQMNVMDAWFIDDDTVGCLWYDEKFNYTLRTLTLSVGEYFEAFSGIPSLNESSDFMESSDSIEPEDSIKSEYSTESKNSAAISFHGRRYGLLVQGNGSTYVYDFKTGERVLMEGFQYTNNISLSGFNQDGTKMLLFRLNSGGNVRAVWIGILDLEKKSFISFEREGSEAPKEYSIGWFDNDRAVIEAHTEEYYYLSLFTIDDR